MTQTSNTRQDWLSVPRRRDEERLDPHVYKRGINGLTVDEAVRRAYPRVMDILKRSGEEYSEFEGRLVRQTIRACLISQVSRANLYRIAGILVADRRDEGAYLGHSLALAYVASLRQAFLPDVSTGERVETPFGPGEVRYVSGDGANAAVALDGGAAREVWLRSPTSCARTRNPSCEPPSLLSASRVCPHALRVNSWVTREQQRAV
jgi:hypothetical protein